MYIQYCLKEQTVLSGHPIQTEVFFFKLLLSYDIFFSVIFFYVDFFTLPMSLHQCSQLKSSFLSFSLFVSNK